MNAFDPFGINRLMGKQMNEVVPQGFGEFMGKAEDPFGLYKSGMHSSPWASMRLDQDMTADEQRQKALAFANAMGAGE